MAGKKGGRSSKTDHVLSLLSGGKEEARPASALEESPRSASVPSDTAGVPSARPAGGAAEQPSRALPREGERLAAPILQVARTNNEALSETIREALSQSLEEELARQPEESPRNEEPPEKPQSGPADTPEVLPEPEPEHELEVESKPAAEPESEPNPPRESAAEAPEEPAPEPPQVPFAPRETRLPDGAVCVNVMELLVDERLERYVRMFGLCCCSRCLADARALALTRLPPKYVVLSAMAATPMLSLYRAKFESQVIAQVIQACKTVMESPRHGQ